MGKAASHANQTTLYLTPLHGRADTLKRLIANVGAALLHGKATAEQFRTSTAGAALCATSAVSHRSPGRRVPASTSDNGVAAGSMLKRALRDRWQNAPALAIIRNTGFPLALALLSRQDARSF
ncbi:hypothetical protein [Rubrivivax gelatinosus]|uniref:Uncharacterized protein n=1 Tax=Rubrivivax gelatinosus (strain NBRC 100245 / IL144) TaxID=983917 RepID=I0HQU9_RUBGI|nr:hypothetical protein [Rubrivivax gelatinosus]BAL95386.1 hypothetical protein RGE_20450 [Rubrivivax gelatinosus IL144]